jgi:hypothetical protein
MELTFGGDNVFKLRISTLVLCLCLVIPAADWCWTHYRSHRPDFIWVDSDTLASTVPATIVDFLAIWIWGVFSLGYSLR